MPDLVGRLPFILSQIIVEKEIPAFAGMTIRK